MKKFKNLLKTLTLITSILIMILAPLALLPMASAQETQTVTIYPVAYLSFRPNPIGVNQTLLVNVWVSPSCPWGLKLRNYTVEFTKPDNSKFIYGPFDAIQSENTAWFEIKVDMIGKWKLKFKSPEQLVEGYYTPWPPGPLKWGSFLYKACESPEMELIVQKEPVPGWPPSDYPSSYWTLPVHPENREWWMITGNWLMSHYDGATRSYNPYSQGPESPHVLWKFQTSTGGIIGGEYGTISYQGGPSASVAVGGLTFITLDGGETVAINMHTGEVVWRRQGVTATRAVIGTGTPGWQGFEAYLFTIVGGRLVYWDAFTGLVRLNVTVPTGISITAYDPPYVYSVQTIGNQRFLIKWDAGSLTTTFSTRIIYNVSYPLPGVTKVSEKEQVGLYLPGWTHGVIGGFNTTNGAIYWMRNTTDLDLENVMGSGCIAYGKYAYARYIPDQQTRMKLIRCIDVYTGNEVWQGEPFDYPWGVFVEYHTHAAYGLFYFETYAGIYALNASTGKIVWHFQDMPEYPYEIPYSQGYPFFSFRAGSAIADGKYYVAEGEHSPTQPLIRGFKLWCLNATTGEPIWCLPGFTTCGSGYGDISQEALIAYGILVIGNRYDNYLYAFGKGPTALEISVTQFLITEGSSVFIKGSVVDKSPAQPGTPAIADEFMGEWMAYLHMQKPAPMNIHGVDVILQAMDENGTIINIGTVTCDALGQFNYVWTPPAPGTYTIMATFAGSKSYWPSYSQTTIAVLEAPEVAAAPAYTTMDLAIIATVIIAIIIGIINLYLITKRK
ncbi:MAG: PQQ-binding-like beta-propeller repeat protein [Candidatus Bathyarchaeia archaeon]